MIVDQQSTSIPSDGTSPPGNGINYADFLRLDELLSLQGDPELPDELMFVVVHQAHELWFKLVVFELERVRDDLAADRLGRAGHGLRRLITVLDLLTGHWAVLDTMLPSDYLKFRDRLRGGSGYQSVQHREIEFLAGLKDSSFLDRAGLPARDRDLLLRRLAEPSVREAFLAALDRRGLADPADLFRAPPDIEPDWPLLQVAERLLDFDAAFGRWRTRHCATVERQIGDKRGTGGTSGVSYLRGRARLRMFPELWNLRGGL